MHPGFVHVGGRVREVDDGRTRARFLALVAALVAVVITGCQSGKRLSASSTAPAASMDLSATKQTVAIEDRCQQVDLGRLAPFAMDASHLRLENHSADESHYECQWSDGSMTVSAFHGTTSGLNTPMSILNHAAASAGPAGATWLDANTVVSVSTESIAPGDVWDPQRGVQRAGYISVTTAGESRSIQFVSTSLTYQRSDGRATANDAIALAGIVHYG